MLFESIQGLWEVHVLKNPELKPLYQKFTFRGWGCSSVVESLPGMGKILSWSPSIVMNKGRSNAICSFFHLTISSFSIHSFNAYCFLLCCMLTLFLAIEM